MSLLILTYNIGDDKSPWRIPIWVYLNMTMALKVSQNQLSYSIQLKSGINRWAFRISKVKKKRKKGN